MRWLRSWPAVVPPRRAYVQDELERLVISDYDYTPLGAIDEDVCLLEWDVALDREGMARFELEAARHPAAVLVAPYRLYGIERRPVWCHRRLNASGRERWIATGEGACDYFSFGCVYLPHALVAAFLASEAPARGRSPFLAPERPYEDRRFNDQTFSIWYRHHYWPDDVLDLARVTWDVRPLHLHW